jgi:hypothetical protein
MIVCLSMAWAAALRTFGSSIGLDVVEEDHPMSEIGCATPCSAPPSRRRSYSS